MNKDIFVLLKTSVNLDISNFENSYQIIGLYSSFDKAQSQIGTFGSNLNFKYQIKGPFQLDNGLFPSKPNFIPDPSIKLPLEPLIPKIEPLTPRFPALTPRDELIPEIISDSNKKIE